MHAHALRRRSVPALQVTRPPLLGAAFPPPQSSGALLDSGAQEIIGRPVQATLPGAEIGLPGAGVAAPGAEISGPPSGQAIGPPGTEITGRHAWSDGPFCPAAQMPDFAPQRAMSLVLPDAQYAGLPRSASWPFLADLRVWTPSEGEMDEQMDVAESPQAFE